MTIKNVIDFGKSKGACYEAMHWLQGQTDADQAWQTCERPDWMIWYAARRNIDRKILVRIACDCARTVLRFVPEGEDRPRIAIETTERWIVGEATIEEVRKARTDAADAYAAAAAAADAATAAADAATAATDAAADAAAAAAADAAAAAAADADARRNANIQMCNIVRKYISYQDVAL